MNTESYGVIFVIAALVGIIASVLGYATVMRYADIAVVLCVLRWIVADAVATGVRAAQK